MTDIKELPSEVLRSELERRERAENVAPIMLTTPDIGAIRKIVSDYIDAVSKGERFKDARYYIFETTMAAFYGPDWHKWKAYQDYDRG